MTAPSLASPLRLEITSAGMRRVLGSLLAVGFIFGVGGLGAGIAVLFNQKAVSWLFFFMLPVPFMLVGGGIFLTALVFFFRRITLVADGSGITRTSRLLLFRRKRHFPRPPLVEVVYSFATGSSDALCLGKIQLAFDDGRRMLLLQRYGMTETRRLAEALRTAVFTEAQPTAHEQPRGGAVTIIEDGPTLRIHLGTEPASRIGADSLTVSTLLLVLSSLFCACFIALWWQADPSASGRTLATTVCGGIWVMFVVICSTIIVKTRRRAREQGDITLDNTTLRIEITGSPAARHCDWPRSAVRSVAVEPSGLQINSQPVYELHLFVGNSSPARFFTGRDVRDLRWIAEKITQQLALPDPLVQRQEVLTHLESPIAAAIVGRIDNKLRFGNWLRLPSQNAIVLQLPPSFLRGLVLYVIGGMWLAVVTGMLVLSLMPSSKTPPSALMFLALFALPAVLLGYFARRMTKATLRVEITAATLTFRSTILRTREVTVPCDKIEGVGTAMVGGDGNYSLYVDLQEGRQWIQLGFSNADLDSLAELLAIALALHSPRS